MRRRITNIRPRRARLCALLALGLLFVSLTLMLAHTRTARAAATRATQANSSNAPHLRYQISFKLNFDERSFNGTERVRWVNRDTRAASAVYFHLYANLHSNDAPRSPQTTASDETQAPDEPRLEINSVRAATTQTPLA